ncbi:outer membrane beta-barrel protein [Bradyrhizobium sp. AUGA SZCCT0240]|uniref:outer membrane protein n=1 Tax=unclassified Bradyrhizobium TaxID=2631580 RepID=UPI001BA75DA8|nr:MULTISPECIES: outer membrane beta-barrel protein [unclassified Bradyrhizobium]MBR1189049.1 outer membrane beta-barrel protein [Bradyrhizobium sp. AUGA SZCCT0160]MBR1199380.1 outer membrane beta-barrel protein [Bradyrhizobium sp. AUGA SZCCT0158]MBR1243327.1 outer membrane beta-barrel protein [Bradyrhizobium sp. AUGA SZCCT0274]MBR1254817.1 outer membrane beta-barrel protein [Bradyrhizobium sp. AUGA SZCCT0240]
MKKFLLGTVALVAFAAPAAAADLAARPYTKAPPMIAAVYDWSGFYIGANGGWGSSRKCWDAVTAAGAFIANEGCHDATGGTAGGQIGYRWQAGTWVFGVEGQGNWADFRGSNVSLFVPATNIRSKIDAFGTFTGQVGWAANNVLFYVKGGAAVTADRFDIRSNVANVVGATTGDDTRWGGVVGVGLEYGFAPNWSAGIEYNHMFMQDRTHTFVSNGAVAAIGPAGVTFNERIRQDVDLVTVRVNYRWGGPVIAKY